MAGIGAAAFYTVLTFLSESVLTDTIYSLGIMICFYYGLTAFGCVWFFRHTLFETRSTSSSSSCSRCSVASDSSSSLLSPCETARARIMAAARVSEASDSC